MPFGRSACLTTELSELDGLLVHGYQIRNSRATEHLLTPAGNKYLATPRDFMDGKAPSQAVQDARLCLFKFGVYVAKNGPDLAPAVKDGLIEEWFNMLPAIGPGTAKLLSAQSCREYVDPDEVLEEEVLQARLEAVPNEAAKALDGIEGGTFYTKEPRRMGVEKHTLKRGDLKLLKNVARSRRACQLSL